MKYLLLLCAYLYTNSIFSQKNDYNWMAGYYSDIPNYYANFLVDFNFYPPKVSSLNTNYFINSTHHSMSDAEGNFLYYSNGCSIWKYDSTSFLISENINLNDYGCANANKAMHLPFGLFCLPFENNDYFIFGFTDQLVSNCFLGKFYYHDLDFSSQSPVLTKQDIELDQGCFKFSCANKHANGRDWWVLIADNTTPRFLRWLVTADSIVGPEIQEIDEELEEGATWDFSPDGNKLLIRNYLDGAGMVIYDFDRCSGLLSNPVKIQLPAYGGWSSVFSPNGRYMYTTDNYFKELIQFDLNATDIMGSKKIVSVYDGFIDTIMNRYTIFGYMQRAPDGKVYIFGGDSHYMHVIDFPDRPGTDCHVRQRAITFPSGTFGANAHYPNYRLGPIDGSSCDSLGINNIPMAMYHYDFEDTLSPLSVTFTNASYYEPTNWYWTFGDSNSSTEVSPVHTYAGPGTYTVCLVVSNQYGADTLCREIQIDSVSGVSNLPVLPLVQVSPNPFNDILQVRLPALVNGVEPKFRLFDLFGREVFSENLPGFDNMLPAARLPAGMYLWQILWGSRVTQSGKLIKM